MKIAIDIDNTICKTTKCFGNIAIKYDREILHKNSTIDFSKVIPRSLDWTKEESENYFKIYNQEVINIPLIKGAKKYINMLYDMGYEITILTARGEKNDDKSYLVTEEYLNKKHIPYNNIIMKCSEKYKLLDNFDFFIDDSMKECESAVNNTNATVIMMKSDQNSNYFNKKVYKTNTWKDIYQYIINYKE